MPRRDRADTLATLHMWTQVVGKIRMAQMPALNHWWHVPLYVSPRGLTTNAMPYGDRLFQLDFDFVDHRLAGEDSDGRTFAIDLVPMSVATFYRAVMGGLASLDIDIPIRTTPVEVEIAIPFEEDEEHASYDRDHARAFWLGLSAAHRTLTQFRGGFIGKASPVHFFWGGFDLAVTRFCGRTAIPDDDAGHGQRSRRLARSASTWSAPQLPGPVQPAFQAEIPQATSRSGASWRAC